MKDTTLASIILVTFTVQGLADGNPKAYIIAEIKLGQVNYHNTVILGQDGDYLNLDTDEGPLRVHTRQFPPIKYKDYILWNVTSLSEATMKEEHKKLRQLLINIIQTPAKSPNQTTNKQLLLAFLNNQTRTNKESLKETLKQEDIKTLLTLIKPNA